MVENTVTEAVKFLEEHLRKAGLRDLRLVLFGSHSLGTVTGESDIDVAIVSSSFRGKDVFERAQLTKDAELCAMRKFKAPFDIITLTPEEFDSESMAATFIKAAAGFS